MSLSVTQSHTATGTGLTTSFAVSGGTGPYVWSVRANGAGGSINASTGLYTPPVNFPTDPKFQFDTIDVVDSLGAMGTSQIMIGDPLLLFCEVLQKELGLANGRVYLWDQKIMQPTDAGLYIAVSVLSCKPFGNTNRPKSGTGVDSQQSVNMYAQLQVDAISRDSSARLRKEEIIMALNSDYAQAQQEGNGFYIGKLPPGAAFTNLSSQDGAAIPYRFAISVAIQYFAVKTQAVPYMDTFAPVSVNYSQS